MLDTYQALDRATQNKKDALGLGPSGYFNLLSNCRPLTLIRNYLGIAQTH